MINKSYIAIAIAAGMLGAVSMAAAEEQVPIKGRIQYKAETLSEQTWGPGYPSQLRATGAESSEEMQKKYAKVKEDFKALLKRSGKIKIAVWANAKPGQDITQWMGPETKADLEADLKGLLEKNGMEVVADTPQNSRFLKLSVYIDFPYPGETDFTTGTKIEAFSVANFDMATESPKLRSNPIVRIVPIITGSGVLDVDVDFNVECDLWKYHYIYQGDAAIRGRVLKILEEQLFEEGA